MNISREQAAVTLSAMHNKYGVLLKFLFSYLFKGVLYPKDKAKQIISLSEESVIIYIARSESVWLGLYFNYVFNILKMPLAQIVAGINIGCSRLLYHPLIDR